MIISFISRDLRDLCHSEYLASKLYSKEVVESLKLRLSEIRAYVSANEISFGKPFFFEEDQASFVRVNLVQGYYILFKIVQRQKDKFEKKTLDLSQVCRLKLESIRISDAND